MNKIVFILLVLLFYYTAPAQTCSSRDDLSRIPGTWKLSETGEISQTAADVAKEKAVLSNIYQIIRNKFTWAPLGGDIFFSTHFPSRWTSLPVAKICNVYEWEMHFMDFQCIAGKIKHNETYTWYYVDVNKMPFDFKESFFVSRLNKEGIKIDEDPETEVYTFLPSIPDAKGTRLYYSTTGFRGGGGGTETYLENNYTMLHRNGVLPFIAMTKKEYYEKWKKYYWQKMKEQEASVDVMAAEYKKMAGGDKMIEAAKKMARAGEVFVNKINAILHSKPAEALALPAIRGEELGEYYDTPDAAKYNWGYVIKPNLAYYNAQLPKHSPQLICLHFQTAYTVQAGTAERNYWHAGFVKELQRIKIMDLLAEKLQPLIIQ